MIYVFSTVRVRKEYFSEAVDFYIDFVSDVLEKEPGCLEYSPTISIDPELPDKDEGTIFVAERWKTVDSFKAHLDMPYRQAFLEKMEPLLVDGIFTRITQRVV